MTNIENEIENEYNRVVGKKTDNSFICNPNYSLDQQKCNNSLKIIIKSLIKIKLNQVEKNTLQELINNLNYLISTSHLKEYGDSKTFKNSIKKFQSFLENILTKTKYTFYNDGHIDVVGNCNTCTVSKFYTTFFEVNYKNIIDLVTDISTYRRINVFLDDHNNIKINDDVSMDKYINLCESLKKNINESIKKICNYNDIDYRNIEVHYNTLEKEAQEKPPVPAPPSTPPPEDDDKKTPQSQASPPVSEPAQQEAQQEAQEKPPVPAPPSTPPPEDDDKKTPQSQASPPVSEPAQQEAQQEAQEAQEKEAQSQSQASPPVSEPVLSPVPAESIVQSQQIIESKLPSTVGTSFRKSKYKNKDLSDKIYSNDKEDIKNATQAILSLCDDYIDDKNKNINKDVIDCINLEFYSNIINIDNDNIIDKKWIETESRYSGSGLTLRKILINTNETLKNIYNKYINPNQVDELSKNLQKISNIYLTIKEQLKKLENEQKNIKDNSEKEEDKNINNIIKLLLVFIYIIRNDLQEKIDREQYSLKPDEQSIDNLENILCKTNENKRQNLSYCKKTGLCTNDDLVDTIKVKKPLLTEEDYICIPILNLFVSFIKTKILSKQEEFKKIFIISKDIENKIYINEYDKNFIIPILKFLHENISINGKSLDFYKYLHDNSNDNLYKNKMDNHIEYIDKIYNKKEDYNKFYDYIDIIIKKFNEIDLKQIENFTNIKDDNINNKIIEIIKSFNGYIYYLINIIKRRYNYTNNVNALCKIDEDDRKEFCKYNNNCNDEYIKKILNFIRSKDKLSSENENEICVMGARPFILKDKLVNDYIKYDKVYEFISKIILETMNYCMDISKSDKIRKYITECVNDESEIKKEYFLLDGNIEKFMIQKNSDINSSIVMLDNLVKNNELQKKIGSFLGNKNIYSYIDNIFDKILEIGLKTNIENFLREKYFDNVVKKDQYKDDYYYQIFKRDIQIAKAYYNLLKDKLTKINNKYYNTPNGQIELKKEKVNMYKLGILVKTKKIAKIIEKLKEENIIIDNEEYKKYEEYTNENKYINLEKLSIELNVHDYNYLENEYNTINNLYIKIKQQEKSTSSTSSTSPEPTLSTSSEPTLSTSPEPTLSASPSTTSPSTTPSSIPTTTASSIPSTTLSSIPTTIASTRPSSTTTASTVPSIASTRPSSTTTASTVPSIASTTRVSYSGPKTDDEYFDAIIKMLFEIIELLKKYNK